MSIGRFFSNICGVGPFHGSQQSPDFEASVLRQAKMLSSQFQSQRVFETHRAFAGKLNFPNGLDTILTDSDNRYLRRSRIGKITLKAAAA